MATKRSQQIAIWIIAVVLAVGSVGFYFVVIIENNRLAEEQQKSMEQQKPKALPGEEAKPFEAASVTELKKDDLKGGTGEEVLAGATVKVKYMGWLPDGTIFDSSHRGGVVEEGTLNLNQVIAGWKEGIPGMKVGGKRMLLIPAAQAYGEAGSPPTIPANTPLAFIVEVTGIQK
ncbi:MAG TPA: FKBP-type peptidyl-prolyl cis-trans isomerase [Candidatus Saccharimonadales bacterium]